MIVNELPRFASDKPVTIDIDENPMYTKAIDSDLAMQWLKQARQEIDRQQLAQLLSRIDF